MVSDPKLPITGQLPQSTLLRVVEGIRIYKQLKGSKLLFSGGPVFNPVPEGIGMAKLAADLGVPEKDIVAEAKSKDTEEQALIIKDIAGKDKMILVTSAYHMPRSMALFKKRGMYPAPAPTGHIIRDAQGFNPSSIFPDRAVLKMLRF